MEDTEIKSLIEETRIKLQKLEEELLKREEKKSRFPKSYKTYGINYVDVEGDFVKVDFLNTHKTYSDYTESEKQKALDDFKYDKFTKLMERIVRAFNTSESGIVYEPDWSNTNQHKRILYYNFAYSSIAFEDNNKYKRTKNSLYCVYKLEEFTVKNIVRELNKEGYTQADLEWWLKY